MTVLLSFHNLTLFSSLVRFGLFDVDFQETHFLAFHPGINKLWSQITQLTKRQKFVSMSGILSLLF